MSVISPPSACTIWSNPGRAPSGAATPKPVMDRVISRRAEAPQRVQTEAQALQHARPVVLDQHVGVWRAQRSRSASSSDLKSSTTEHVTRCGAGAH